jgi:hypothetical protein
MTFLVQQNEFLVRQKDRAKIISKTQVVKEVTLVTTLVDDKVFFKFLSLSNLQNLSLDIKKKK